MLLEPSKEQLAIIRRMSTGVKEATCSMKL